VKAARGSRTARHVAQAGDDGARARLDALFDAFDRLTPDELARIGLVRADPFERQALHSTVTAAARSGGRSALLSEANEAARDAVLRRYAAGGLRPTWLGLNWGVSQGTTNDRVAIVEALEDAAAAAVVEDLVDPAVVDALSIDADRLLRLPIGDASEGSLDRALRPSPTWSWPRRLAIIALAALAGAWGFGIGIGAGLVGGVIGFGVGLLIVRMATRIRLADGDPRSDQDPPPPGG
jgi:hypothetical protein